MNLGGEYAPASYTVDDHGFVHLRGVVTGGENEKAVFTLPVGARPSRREVFMALSNGALARLDVRSTGEIVPQGASTVYLSLSGVSFLAEK